MIDHHRAGLIPPKPHTAHRTESGTLLHEEMFTRVGFDGPFSYFYHQHPITPAEKVETYSEAFPIGERCEEAEMPLRRRLYDGCQAWDQAQAGDHLDHCRTPVVFNADVTVWVAAPGATSPRYFSNGDGDELWFVRSGEGVLESSCGMLPFGPGDYVVIPRSLTHRIHIKSEKLELLGFECRNGVRIPKQFRNPVGQLTMMAPYTHRDFRKPEGPIAQVDNLPEGPKELLVKKLDRFSLMTLERCPMDVVGWEGFVYPVAFNIHDYQPKTGQLHLPPTVHITFASDGLIVCSFVPRVTDYHEKAIPCPYPHSSVDCDELILYLDGDFTSRRGVGPGSISLHPAGTPHGPHPGAYEASIGHKQTSELAVMIDTFKPMHPTAQALGIERRGYHESWQILSQK